MAQELSDLDVLLHMQEEEIFRMMLKHTYASQHSPVLFENTKQRKTRTMINQFW